MDVLLYIGLFIISLAVLLFASDKFIDSAESIGLSFGISPFIIGVTIVAFGTSLPELATSVAGVLNGNSDVVLGNVVGSNITNIAMVLGLVAVVVKQIDLEYNIWHVDMPFLWGSAFILYFICQDQQITMAESFILLAGIVIFLSYSFNSTDDDKDNRPSVNWITYMWLIVGGILVSLSADYTIYAMSELSAMAGVPTEIIALTVVAIGTSLPEAIVSLNAAKKGKTSIAVGNVLGSNIFNTYVVTGIASLFGPIAISNNIVTFGIPFMIAMTILFGLASNNKKITRWEGVLLLFFYVFFLINNIESVLL